MITPVALVVEAVALLLTLEVSSAHLVIGFLLKENEEIVSKPRNSKELLTNEWLPLCVPFEFETRAPLLRASRMNFLFFLFAEKKEYQLVSAKTNRER